jgi:hypothetical protein
MDIFFLWSKIHVLELCELRISTESPFKPHVFTVLHVHLARESSPMWSQDVTIAGEGLQKSVICLARLGPLSIEEFLRTQGLIFFLPHLKDCPHLVASYSYNTQGDAEDLLCIWFTSMRLTALWWHVSFDYIDMQDKSTCNINITTQNLIRITRLYVCNLPLT